MKTDSLFYDTFKFDPQILFELVQLNIQGTYTFESITTKSTESKHNALIELLEYAILQRFPRLSSKELLTLLELTPLDKTAAGQELIQMGMKKGIKKGELIGEIRLAQRILKKTLCSTKELASKSIKELTDIFRRLEADLSR